MNEPNEQMTTQQVGVAAPPPGGIALASGEDIFPVIVVVFIIVGNIVRFIAKSRENKTPSSRPSGPSGPSSPASSAEEELRKFLQELTGEKPTPPPPPTPMPAAPQPAAPSTAAQMRPPAPPPVPKQRPARSTFRQPAPTPARAKPHPTIPRTPATPSLALGEMGKSKPILSPALSSIGAVPRAPKRSAAAKQALDLLDSPEKLKQAVVLREILGPPAGMRPGFGHSI